MLPAGLPEGRLLKATLIQAAALSLFLAATPSVAAPLAPSETVPVKSRQIENFKIGSDQKRFGKLEFIGGIEMSSSNALLGAISSIRFRPDRKSFLAIMDTGHWVEGEIRRDQEGKLSGTSDLTVTLDDRCQWPLGAGQGADGLRGRRPAKW